ncbi:hypothetical protein AT258_18745 [Bacillus wiedmannii]|uniref:site-specific integrase n=1 Tax=Bacillus TaxID=1386 RepID=UPI00030D6038|nr:site-specific integrase [Bacillus cereus]KXY71938.1 hypothetical protein AT258_18745 [Bacillus wiedmannii]HDR4563388.1 site-specific integrase [Bacillus luti]KYQ02977.1 hypothetical protein B4079_1853 [Bacillus cereus]MBL3852757.1 site-specific integrase [Bacillus cereus]HDR4564083.1 site-specific integrase [Bacillus luti]
MEKDSKKVSQTIKKMEDALDRMQRVKAKIREEKKAELEEKVANGEMTAKEMRRQLPKAWSDSTVGTYKAMMKSFIREVHRDHGYSDMKKIAGCLDQHVQKRLESYYSGNMKEAYNVKTLIAAVKGFNAAVTTTKAFTKVPANRQNFVVQGVESIQKELKENNVLRYSSASSVITPTRKEIDSVLYNIKNDGHGMKDDPHNMRRIAYVTSKLQAASGGRISNTLGLKVGQVRELLQDGQITFRKDKGGLTREVIQIPIDKELRTELTKMLDGKAENSRAFVARKSDGKFLSIKETRKSVNKLVSDAAEHLKREKVITVKDKDGNKKEVTIQKKFSTHSFRKGFALERTVSYLDKFRSHKDAEEYLRERSKENPKIWQKYQEVKKRINNPRQQKDGTYKGRRTARELTRLELAYFACSTDLGHFRLGIVENFYCSPQEVTEHYQNMTGEAYAGFPGQTKRGL